MKTENFDINAYLQRINYQGSLRPSPETLRALHVAHLHTVPFENLSIHWREPIALSDDALFEKIVRRRRGGFCYELNGLFAALLRALGFRVEMVAAGVMGGNGRFGPEFDHMALVVSLEERWLADVGFGDSFREPLLLDERGQQLQGKDAYRIDSGEEYMTLVRRTEGDWKPQYRFKLQPYEYRDYEEMCRYHQTSPESHFTRKRVCTLATALGRITLSDLRLIKTVGEAGEREERLLAGEEECAAVLREQFGISREEFGAS